MIVKYIDSIRDVSMKVLFSILLFNMHTLFNIFNPFSYQQKRQAAFLHHASKYRSPKFECGVIRLTILKNFNIPGELK